MRDILFWVWRALQMMVYFFARMSATIDGRLWTIVFFAYFLMRK